MCSGSLRKKDVVYMIAQEVIDYQLLDMLLLKPTCNLTLAAHEKNRKIIN